MRSLLPSLVCVAWLASMSCGQHLIFSFHGAGNDDNLGFTVSDAGDVNNDGIADVIAGAPDRSHPVHQIPTGPGSVVLWSGSNGAVIQILAGPPPFWQGFGSAVLGCGDLNGDGFGDFAVGVPHDICPITTMCSNDGSVRFYSGLDGTLIHVVYSPMLIPGLDAYGSRLSRMSDLNGDGVFEIGVSAPCYFAAFCLGYGQIIDPVNGNILTHLVLTGLSPDGACNDIVDLGDLGSNGVRILATGNTDGVVHHYQYPNGSQPAFYVNGSWPGSPTGGPHFGWSMAALGDVNGDGFPEYAVGGRGNNHNGPQAGAVTVLTGPNSTPLFQVFGDQPGDRFGSRLCSGGDFNGDGIMDFAVGADQLDFGVLMQPEFPGVTGPGYVRVFSGLDGKVLAHFVGPAFGAGFGYAISFLSDINSDGADELIVGAPRHDTSGFTNNGSVYVFSGVPVLPDGAGTVGVGFGVGPLPVLTVQGQTGGSPRRVNLGYGQPVTFHLAQPPFFSLPARAAVFASLIQPNTQDVTSTFLGPFVFPPKPFFPNWPHLGTLMNSFWNDPFAFGPPTFLPWTRTVTTPFYPFQITVQALLEQDNSLINNTDLAISNAVTLMVP